MYAECILYIAEGSELQSELEYSAEVLGEGVGSTNQMLIQTGTPDRGVLTPDALLQHLSVLKHATSVTVEMFDT